MVRDGEACQKPKNASPTVTRFFKIMVHDDYLNVLVSYGFYCLLSRSEIYNLLHGLVLAFYMITFRAINNLLPLYFYIPTPI